MRPVYSPTAMGEIEEPHRITLTGAIALRLLVPAVIGGATGAFVAVASWLTEDRALGALATVSGGGSQGLESASAISGAAAGDILGRLLRARVPEDERRSLMVAGASAGIAAVFSSPGVGALYGIEIPFRRDIDARRLVPCAIAAAWSFAVRDAIAGARHLVVLETAPVVDATFIAGVVLVGVACGLGARLFARVGEDLKRLARRGTPLARAAAAGTVLAGLAVAGRALSGTWITFGPGYVAAHWLDAGPHPIWLLLATLLVRTAGTLICVYGGGGGGVFTSLACTGVFNRADCGRAARSHRVIRLLVPGRRMLPRVGVSPAARVHDVRPRRGELDRRRGCGPRGRRDRPGADGPGVGLGCEARRAARLKPDLASLCKHYIRHARLPASSPPGASSESAQAACRPAQRCRARRDWRRTSCLSNPPPIRQDR